MGGETQRGGEGSMVKGKRTPILSQRLGNSQSINEINFSLEDKFFRIELTLEM
jgi:hypothetical protein